MAKKKKKEEVILVKCRNCGTEQADAGMNTVCEECDEPLPTQAPGAKGTELEATKEDIVRL